MAKKPKTTPAELKAKIKEYNKQKEVLRTEIKRYVQDKSFPLEERWKLFIESELGTESSWTVHFSVLDGKDVSYYDDFYIEKYQTTTVKDLVDMIGDKEPEDNMFLTDGELNSLKEDILKQFIWSWKEDW
jgi:hypothetical protein